MEDTFYHIVLIGSIIAAILSISDLLGYFIRWLAKKVFNGNSRKS